MKPRTLLLTLLLTTPILAASPPQIHGPKLFGTRPNSPFLYAIPATGDRPLTFSADNLPATLSLDSATGRITGTLPNQGEFPITLHAKNALGQSDRPFKIIAGDTLGLTPAMGWNNYDLTGVRVTQADILKAAHGMIDSGLAQHGWTYINCDDGWQGLRGGDLNAIQPNDGFPDIAAMVTEIHSLGLKAGIYSTPWVTSYGRHIGGSSEDPTGKWDPSFAKQNNKDHSQKFPFAIASHHFAENDAKQFAAWGFDYLKYDWAPIHAPDTKEMFDALAATHRDLLFSLSNNGLYTLQKEIAEVSPYANSWRITDDVHDQWKHITLSAFNQDVWAPSSRPGHFNDPDMLVIGTLGWGKPRPSRLTQDEQTTQFSMWCMLNAPLLLGCDLTKLDPFTLSLITNDDVIDIDQDSLGKQATLLSESGPLAVYAKPLDNGDYALALCNRGPTPAPVSADWSSLKLPPTLQVRNLWPQKDLGPTSTPFTTQVPSHGTVLLRLHPAP